MEETKESAGEKGVAKHRWYDSSSSDEEDGKPHRSRIGTIRLTTHTSCPTPGGSIHNDSPSPLANRRTNLTRSRELLLVARNAREHSREKDALRAKLQTSNEMLESLEQEVKEEKRARMMSEARGRATEQAMQAMKTELNAVKSQAESEMENRDKALKALEEELTNAQHVAEEAKLEANNKEGELLSSQADAAASRTQVQTTEEELERLRMIEEQTSGLAAELMERCNKLRSELAQAERHADEAEKAIENIHLLGGQAALMTSLTIDKLDDVMADAQASCGGSEEGRRTGALLEQAFEQLEQLKELLPALVVEAQHNASAANLVAGTRTPAPLARGGSGKWDSTPNKENVLNSAVPAPTPSHELPPQMTPKYSSLMSAAGPVTISPQSSMIDREQAPAGAP